MDLSKVKIAGPQTITFAGVNMGHTLDGVEFSYEREFEDVVVDKYGSMPVDKVLTGSKVMIKFKLAQAEWRQWNLAIPETSSYDGAGTADRVDLGADAGYSLRGDSAALLIHPTRLSTSDQTEDITIYKAVSVENIEVPYKIDEQKVIEVTLMGLVDESYETGRRLGHIGSAAVSQDTNLT